MCPVKPSKYQGLLSCLGTRSMITSPCSSVGGSVDSDTGAAPTRCASRTELVFDTAVSSVAEVSPVVARRSTDVSVTEPSSVSKCSCAPMNWSSLSDSTGSSRVSPIALIIDLKNAIALESMHALLLHATLRGWNRQCCARVSASAPWQPAKHQSIHRTPHQCKLGEIAREFKRDSDSDVQGTGTADETTMTRARRVTDVNHLSLCLF